MQNVAIPLKHAPQVIGNTGLYYACYHLSRLGWNVMPTSRNARGIDIIAYNAAGSHYLSFQVKSLSKRNPVPLGKSIDILLGDYWIVVNNIVGEPIAFILLPEEIRSAAHRGERDGRISYWLQPNTYDLPRYREAWPRIPSPH